MAEITKGWNRVLPEVENASDCSLKVLAHYVKPALKTVAVAEAKAEDPALLYNRAYFDGDSEQGYRKPGYHNFPSNYSFAAEILKMKPESVLELGGGRGYITKLLESFGIKAVCLDISKHCWYTRACNNFVLTDAAKPLPFEDKQFDAAFSKDFIEHIDESKLPALIREMARVSKRGYHAVTFSTHPTAHEDSTHRTLKPEAWWWELFRAVAPDYPVIIVDKEAIEQKQHGIAIGQMVDVSNTSIQLNIGSFLDMHYGWTNIDIIDLSAWAAHNGYKFSLADITKRLMQQDSSIALINCSHALEHLTRAQGLMFLRECNRILKDGGIIRIGVPDARTICDAYLNNRIMDYKEFNVGVENSKDSAEALYEMLLSGHMTCYDADSVINVLREIGFVEVERMKFGKSKSKVVEQQVIDMYPEITSWCEGVARKGDNRGMGVVSLPQAKSTPVSDLQKYLKGEIKEGVNNFHLKMGA